MTKTSLLFMLACATCALDGAFGLGTYYWQPYLDNQDLIAYPQLSARAGILQPECDSKEGSSESESSSSSSEEIISKSKKSKEKSSSSSSSEESGGAKESKESGEKASLRKESKEEKSGELSKESSKESSKEEKSGENSKESKSKESSEESKEKKKEGHKKKKGKESVSLFPPRARTFSARQMQPIVYSPLSTYSDSPYRASYVVKQPVASYPLKTYQYITLPSSASIVNAYSSPVVGKMFANTLPKVVYSSPSTAKTVIVPGNRVYSSSVPVGYSFKK